MNLIIFSPFDRYFLVIARVGMTGIDGSSNQSSLTFSPLKFNLISGSSYTSCGIPEPTIYRWKDKWQADASWKP
jgi:hypothetical protein